LYFFYFYPIGINRKRERQPVLSWGLMVFMLVVFVWTRYFPDFWDFHPNNLIFYPGNGHPWTVATAVFLHAGWLHLLGNMAYFNVFGPVLESRVGSGLFFISFLVMGIFGNLVHGLVASLGLFGQYGVGVLGASGAIAGLLAFGLVRFHTSRVEVAWWVFAPLIGQNRAGRSKIPILAAVGLWLMLQVIHSLVASQTGASVSYGAHFGGFFMGLVLAMGLGQWREGRQEGMKDKARRYFRDGAFHAAVGVWIEYLELVSTDWDARMELAQAQVMTGQTYQAQLNFQRVFRRYAKQGAMDTAIRVFQEGNRAGLISALDPSELATVAHYQEKQMEYSEAAKTHEQLFTTYWQHSEGQRSLVRLVMLHRGKIQNPEALRHWRETANRALPLGPWRDFLEEEFRQEGGLGAVVRATPQEDHLQPKP
jgi:rhomboid family protein